MSLLDLRKAVANELAARLPKLGGKTVKVAEHGGRFDAEELRRCAAAAPAVLVAVMGSAGLEESAAEISGTCQLATVIVTKDMPKLPRDVAALALVQAVSGIVPGNCWGAAAEKAPEDIRCDNLFSAAVDKIGVAMWGVGWRQRAVITRLGVAESAEETLDRFLVCDVKTTLAVGAPIGEDEINLPQTQGDDDVPQA